MPRLENPEVGERVPSLTTNPLSRVTLALFAGASGDHNPIHIDIDYAREAGLDDVFAHGMLSMAYLGRLLTNWAPQRALRGFSVRFVAIARIHERLVCTGRVIERLKLNGEPLARLELTVANEQGDVRVVGEATVALSGQ